MTRSRRKIPGLPRHLANDARQSDASGGRYGAEAPPITAEDWRHTLDTLAATARARDGDLAARKVEIRHRMRALARAMRGQSQ